MKIIQITVVNGEFPQFFGLTDSGKIVRYNWKKGSWSLFKNQSSGDKPKA